MCENGDAKCLLTEILIVSTDDGVLISFDGKNWEKTESHLIKNAI